MGEWFNCKKIGHKKEQFWAKGGGNEGNYPKRGDTNSAKKESRLGLETCWLAF
jgi:hypothetical protein